MKQSNVMSKRGSKVANFFLYLALFTSSVSALQYIKESFDRNMILAKKSYAERQVYMEKTFKYLPYYEYSQWIEKTVPEGYSYSLYDDHTAYSYYYSRLNYFLYPKYIVTNRDALIKMNERVPGAEKELTYNDIVFALDLKPGSINLDRNGIKYSSINNKKYYLVARSGNNYILITKPFLKNVVLKDFESWTSLINEFNKLYPKKNIKVFND